MERLTYYIIEEPRNATPYPPYIETDIKTESAIIPV
jgi:hypothetical protein